MQIASLSLKLEGGIQKLNSVEVTLLHLLPLLSTPMSFSIFAVVSSLVTFFSLYKRGALNCVSII